MNLYQMFCDRIDNDSGYDNAKLAKDLIDMIPDTALNKVASSQRVSERFLLVEWIDDNPCIDGAKYFNDKESLLRHYESLPKIDLVKYTICTIRNAH